MQVDPEDGGSVNCILPAKYLYATVGTCKMPLIRIKKLFSITKSEPEGTLNVILVSIPFKGVVISNNFSNPLNLFEISLNCINCPG